MTSGSLMCRTNTDQMDDIWNEILGEISEIERKKDHLDFIGDINRQLRKVSLEMTARGYLTVVSK